MIYVKRVRKGEETGTEEIFLEAMPFFPLLFLSSVPSPLGNRIFLSWPISGQKVLDSDKTVYKDVLNNRLLCPPPAYPIANHFVVLYVFVFDHIQPTTLIIFDHKSWPQWIILDLYQS